VCEKASPFAQGVHAWRSCMSLLTMHSIKGIEWPGRRRSTGATAVEKNS